MDRKFTYESVEYSDGYYHTIFNPAGEACKECNSEQEAKEITKRLNDARIKGSDHG